MYIHPFTFGEPAKGLSLRDALLVQLGGTPPLTPDILKKISPGTYAGKSWEQGDIPCFVVLYYRSQKPPHSILGAEIIRICDSEIDEYEKDFEVIATKGCLPCIVRRITITVNQFTKIPQVWAEEYEAAQITARDLERSNLVHAVVRGFDPGFPTEKA